MGNRILIVGTYDTKDDELNYIAAVIRGQGGEAGLQRAEREAMRHLGIEAVEEGEGCAFEQGHQTPSGKMWPVAPRGRDLSQMTSDRRRLR